jgi:hypothetical protein
VATPTDLRQLADRAAASQLTQKCTKTHNRRSKSRPNLKITVVGYFEFSQVDGPAESVQR